MPSMENARILIMSTHGFEQSELEYPLEHLKKAGAKWEGSEVAIDNGIITSRSPKDHDAFVNKIIEEVREGEHHRNSANAA